MSCALASNDITFVRPSSAYLVAARTERPAESTVTALEQNQASRRDLLLSRYMELLEECGADNWDGQGATALRADSADRFFELAFLIPEEMPIPELGVTPSGSLTFDWEDGKDWLLTLILSADDTLSFAAFYKGARLHGTFPFYSERLPEEVALAFRRWRTGPKRA